MRGKDLKNICEYTGIMDKYEEYLDRNIDRNELIELCQEKMSTMVVGEQKMHKSYTNWLGI